jgi:hypothetical protein
LGEGALCRASDACLLFDRSEEHSSTVRGQRRASWLEKTQFRKPLRCLSLSLSPSRPLQQRFSSSSHALALNLRTFPSKDQRERLAKQRAGDKKRQNNTDTIVFFLFGLVVVIVRSHRKKTQRLPLPSRFLSTFPHQGENQAHVLSQLRAREMARTGSDRSAQELWLIELSFRRFLSPSSQKNPLSLSLSSQPPPASPSSSSSSSLPQQD